ncbi:hypothetical protein [Flavobacterium selenitireducens]|uniref:hypothetical protein n=1 Tax=Flavobacterium selenitireducens TaxID=2722704 RepID=UPI00168B2861|nr:hypothetical protein [Flavobacterium selenitireducens]MBD3584054.1 hypothetical protein [Flavobacterium selenitireducens]
MKLRTFIILLSISLLICCNENKSANKPEDYLKVLNQKESESQKSSDETPGKLISTIDFEVKAKQEDLKIFEDGKIPWISIENPESEIGDLFNADEIVIKEPSIEINIDYPLNKPFKFKLQNPNGFTRRQLALEISKKYKEMYAEEESTAKTKTIPMNERKGIINRNETDGKFGIWGHDIQDLDLGSIEVYRNPSGNLELLLDIQS